MTYKFDIDPTRRLIVERWTGVVTIERLVRGLAKIEQHVDFDPAYDVVANYREARIALSIDDLGLFPEEVRSRGWTKMRRRVVVTPEDLSFGIGRQAKAFWQVDGLMVFRTEPEVWAWLNEDPRSRDTS